MIERLKKQLDFIIEIDKVKHIFRHTRLFDHSRYENDAEHSWHLALMAIVLSEHSNSTVDIAKVIKMALIHDIVEIDAGDTLVYAEQLNEQRFAAEQAAARRIFGMLPDDQRDEMIRLWEEFEKKETIEARFAGALDRLEPVLQNCLDNGYAWHKNAIDKERVLSLNRRIGNGSQVLWEYIRKMIEEVFAGDGK
jgi:putative hydrolases of HD superfamily